MYPHPSALRFLIQFHNSNKTRDEEKQERAKKERLARRRSHLTNAGVQNSQNKGTLRKILPRHLSSYPEGGGLTNQYNRATMRKKYISIRRSTHKARTRDSPTYILVYKVYNGTRKRQHEAALVINRFSRKRNVTGTLVQALAQSNE